MSQRYFVGTFVKVDVEENDEDGWGVVTWLEPEDGAHDL